MTQRLALFDHLPRKSAVNSTNTIEGDKNIHPSTIKIGLYYKKGIIREDDDRVASLIAMFCNVINDYKTPPNKSLAWDLDKHIKLQVQYLVSCRQHTMGMGNLIKYLRFAISRIPLDINESEAKQILISKLNSFLEERVLYSREAITKLCTSVILDGDVILTYGSSPLLREILTKTSLIKRFKLIIVDSRPLNEGLITLKALSNKIPCIYTPISGVPSLIKTVTKVILGASSLLSNGSMLAPAGTAMVASLGKSQGIPVIVACEGYKFCEKVQVDSIVYNELGAVNEIAVLTTNTSIDNSDGLITSISNSSSLLSNEAIPQLISGYRGSAGGLNTNINSNPNSKQTKQSSITISPEDIETSGSNLPYQVINLRYDLTPLSHISAVATETGLIPPTSIPVLLKEFKVDLSIGGSID